MEGFRHRIRIIFREADAECSRGPAKRSPRSTTQIPAYSEGVEVGMNPRSRGINANPIIAKCLLYRFAVGDIEGARVPGAALR